MDQNKHELWEQHICSLEASGLSPRRWSEEQGVRLSQLYYWRRKLRPKDVASPKCTQWVGLNTHSLESSGISLRIGDITLNVERGFDHQVLADIVRTLITIC